MGIVQSTLRKKKEKQIQEIETLNRNSLPENDNNQGTIEVNNLLSVRNDTVKEEVEFLENQNNTREKSKATSNKSEMNSKPSSFNNISNVEVSREGSNILKRENEEVRELDSISNKIVSNTHNIMYRASNELSNLEQQAKISNIEELDNNLSHKLEEIKSNAEDLGLTNSSHKISPTVEENQGEGEKINQTELNKHLIKKVQEASLLNNQKPPDVKTFDEFKQHIPEEKMKLLASFMRNVDTDAFLLLAKNKTHLDKELNPSCQKIHKLINKPMVVSNKLGTNYKLDNLSSLPNRIRGKSKKPILYFDAQESMLCLPENKKKKIISICSHHNVYQEYFYPYEKYKFGMNKQLYNLDVWLLLFQNIYYYDNLEDTKLGTLLDLFEIVIILPEVHYQNMVSSHQKGSLNLFSKNKFHFISAEDKLTPGILSFYLYSKFYLEGDILLSPTDFTYLQHGEGISINGKYKFLEEYLPFIVQDMEMMKEILGQFYPNFNFITEKINLNAIKRKKYSKKKSPKMRKKKSKGEKLNVTKVKGRRKYSRKQ